MLEELRIGGLGVIDDAVLELAPGLTVVTGETGAGKTMVVSGLQLLFGGRADSGMVRSGFTRAAVDGRVRLDPHSPVAGRVDELGGDVDDGVVVLSRIVGVDGRSRAQVGGRAVPVGMLAELAEELLAVHGQADQLRLRSAGHQRAALDRYGGAELATALRAYQDVYRRHRDAETALHEVTTHAAARAREADALRYALAEIDAEGLQPGEDRALAVEIERLAHADLLRTAAADAHAALAGDLDRDDVPDAVSLVGGARNALERVTSHDPVLAGLAGRLVEVGYVLADVAAELAGYADGVETDPLRLGFAQERQAVLAALIRKYAAGEQPGVDGVLAWAEDARQRLAAIQDDDSRIDELTDELQRLRSELLEQANRLTASRVAAAKRFGVQVSAELAGLAMPHASISAEVRPTGGYGSYGADDVELAFAPHAGASARSLTKGASGGELSRVMLAVEVVLAGSGDLPTFVFDEVDAGVGGRAAAEVGKRLARLARSAQVIVVTHLPQVAVFADQHLVVVKSDDGVVTRSGVVALEGAARIRELSRMLAGLDGSTLAEGHAAELVAAAQDFKAAL